MLKLFLTIIFTVVAAVSIAVAAHLSRAFAIASVSAEGFIAIIATTIVFISFTIATNVIDDADNGAGIVAISLLGTFTVPVGAYSAFRRKAFAEGVSYSVVSILLLIFALYTFLKLIKRTLKAIGTNFSRADLNSSNFNYAKLENTSFSGANLHLVDWTEAKFSQCLLSRSFEDPRVVRLCTQRSGRGQNYCHANLNGLYLAGVDFTDALLTSTDLSKADLHHAILANANLSNTQALGTNFSEANLTGVCIQNWGINSETNFTNVRCDYIYLEPNQQERKPASGTFQPGDFEKLAHQFTKTLDFLFRNGIDPEAFDFALKNLLIDYENAGLSMHSVVDVGDGDRLVRFNRENPNVDPGAMHAQFSEDYAFMQIQLGEAREQNHLLEKDLAHVKGQIAIYEKHDTLLSIVLGRPTISIQDSQIGEFMSDKGNKVKIGRIGGDASGISGGDNSGVAGKNITGAAGGDISGTLTIALDQLEDSQDPQALKLAELLKQVKTAIEKSDSGLSEADQQKALKHLETIGKLGTDPKNPDLLEKAGDALDALPTIIKRGNNLAEFAEKYFPPLRLV